MDQNHPYRDDIPAYALGALDAQEAAALEAHLQTCDTCRSELADYQQVSDQLLAALPPQAPPVSLRGKLQHRLPGKQKTVRPKFGWLSGQLALGMAVLTLVALNIFSLIQIQTLKQDQARLTQKYENGEAALAMLSSTGTKSIPVSAGGVSGTILVNQTANTGILIIWNLPVLQQNQTYQAWLIDPQDSDHFAPSAAPFMVNYRVEDLHALVGALKEEGCTVLEKIDESEYGKFAWVIDPEGNKVELWEPPAGQ